MIIASKYCSRTDEIQFEKPQFPGSDTAISGLRYYNPSSGRWLSRDPIGERGGANLLMIVGNNTISRVDILGKVALVDDVTIGAVLAIGAAVGYVASPEGQAQMQSAGQALGDAASATGEAIGAAAGSIADAASRLLRRRPEECHRIAIGGWGQVGCGYYGRYMCRDGYSGFANELWISRDEVPPTYPRSGLINVVP